MFLFPLYQHLQIYLLPIQKKNILITNVCNMCWINLFHTEVIRQGATI